MADRCFSTLICAKSDQEIFQKIGYKPDTSQAITIDGDDIPDAQVMIDEEAAGGHYDELTTLSGVPFLVSNGACLGAFGDHLITCDGHQWSYVEALNESNYPAVRVNRDGSVSGEDIQNACKYWRLYEAALDAFKKRVS